MSDPFLTIAPVLLQVFGRTATYTATSAYPPDVRTVRAILTKNAEIVGQYGEMLERRPVADLDATTIPTPRAGDTLLINGTLYTVDRLASDNDYLVRVILR